MRRERAATDEKPPCGWEDVMKALVIALGLMALTIPEANAVVCAKGVYRAGCAGAGGAAVVRRPAYGAAVVHRPVAAGCYYRAGVRICR
jgi:hypothetical protein